ncbi:hypothetical protein RHSIM_Rhsim10G0198500 [Rhododendron simsii]|uniref:Zinc finger PHD-type domain-containing protein n=1 Tax=Rhododendron simsii TaxID=118357 RepID=A0A834GAW2_RHOSS|nr:hypothetical protein RHSIM_Rhsim10G0198500 [Rhododendron simsii]
MSTPLEAFKKRKWKLKICGLHDTSGEPNCPIAPAGPFLVNIRQLLLECAPQGYSIRAIPVWRTTLIQESMEFEIPLYILEESVENSETPFCAHCSISGWSHNFVSKRKYHMIIPHPENVEWNNHLDEGVFDPRPNLLLRGLIHCNGFGHLLGIIGMEGGFSDAMDIWDHVCTTLGVRKITVLDTPEESQSQNQRLLENVVDGQPWFGRWGYRFVHGSFGAKQEDYEAAVESLSSIELDEIARDFSTASFYKDYKIIIDYHRDFNQTKLITLRDLLRYMRTLKSTIPQRSANVANGREYPHVADRPRLQHVADVVVDALKEKKERFNCGMTRQEAYDAATASLQIDCSTKDNWRDRVLVSKVLKEMDDVAVGGVIVRQVVNNSTRIKEYTIEPEVVPWINDVDKVFDFVCKNVLMGAQVPGRIKRVVKKVVDIKLFINEWHFKDAKDQLRFNYRFRSHGDADFSMREGEIIELPLHSTVGDLKAKVQKAIRDTYFLTENVVVTGIEGMEGVQDSSELDKCNSDLWVATGSHSEWKYEGGVDPLKLRCICGATDEDTERKVGCNGCEFWQHTVCNHIADSEEVLAFLCNDCGESCEYIGFYVVSSGGGVRFSTAREDISWRHFN